MGDEITKAHLRRTTLQYRQLLPEQEYKNRNDRLLDRLQHFLRDSSFRTLHTFLSMRQNKEPDLHPLFSWFFESNYKVVVSKTDFSTRSMSHFLLEPATIIEKNAKGIPEPMEAKPALLSDVEVILVPLTLVDKKGHRIGYGGGYYDQLLQETKATKVGLSLGSPVDNITQRDSWDIPLNHLITPFKTYNYG